jgi:hypothetical protein
MSGPIIQKALSGVVVGMVTFTGISHSFHPASDPRNELEALLPSLPDEGPHRAADGVARILDLNAAAVSGSSSFGAVTHNLRLGDGLTFTDRDGVSIRLHIA